MMLDMKRTFDEVVESQASPEKAKQILENPFYIALSSSFAGTQEYMAMEKLGQIHKDAQSTGAYDLIVVDTPPSRSALDFLDAPERLSSFLDGRFIRLLLAPGPRAGADDDGRARPDHERADEGARRPGAARHADVRPGVRHPLRRASGSARRRRSSCCRPTARRSSSSRRPNRTRLREAAYFVERLSEDRMPLAGLVVNRASPAPVGDLSADEAMTASARLRKQEPTAVAAGLLRLHADRSRLVEREALLRDRFAAAHPTVPTAVVPALAGDVHDLAGLRRVAELLADG